MIRLEWLFIMQLAMGVAMIVLLQKLMQMKRQIDEVTREVMNYISYITEEMEKEDLEEDYLTKKEVSTEKRASEGRKGVENAEAQNHLIQAVLGDYFQ